MTVCPECGQDHNSGIDRDITAIVVAVLQDGTVEDFIELIGDPDRMPMMLLRACQILAQVMVMLAMMEGYSTVEDARARALETLQQTLLHGAEHETEENE